MTSVTHKHFLVYKITNTLNGKTYIGCHETYNPDDSYMGSGKYLKRAQNKYGLENFKKEVLFKLKDRASMFEKEKFLISAEKPEYNLHEGGRGGWQYINSRNKAVSIETLNKLHGYAAHKHKLLRLERIKFYNNSPNKCKACLKPFSYEKRNYKYCGHSCAAKCNSKNRKMKSETKIKISQTLINLNRSFVNNCKNCAKRIKPNSKTNLCRNCLIVSKRTFDEYDVKEWKRLSKSMSSRKISTLYSVSHSTVLKHIK